MFLEGIARVDNVVNDVELLTMKNAIIQAKEKGILSIESDKNFYKDSYGTASLPEIDALYDKLTPIVEGITGLSLEKQNSYSRIYYPGSTLNKHLDREGLEITVSLQVYNSTGKFQPVFCQDYNGDSFDANLNDGDMVIIRGRDLYHWRNPLETLNQDGALICSFFHWNIKSSEIVITDNFLSPTACNAIIEDAEKIGFERSKVIKGGEDTYDPHSRSSSTMWFTDNWRITDILFTRFKEINKLKIEGWQLVKYQEGEQFAPHFDCLDKEGDRLFTCLLYLNDDFEGGETIFQNKNITILPKQGTLVFWKNLLSLKCDPKSIHSSAPITKGVKYILVTWIRNNI